MVASWKRVARFGVPMVVYFHEIAPSGGSDVPAHPSLRIEPALFEWTLSRLGRWYQFAHLDEVVTSGNPRLIAITFDDGYQGVFRHAFPVLRQRNIPVSVFLITDYVGTNRPPWWDRLLLQVRAARERGTDAPRRLGALEARVLGEDGEIDESELLLRFKAMPGDQRSAVQRVLDESVGEPTLAERVFLSEEEIVEMARAGVQFGAHTRSHPLLTWLDEKALLQELDGSRADVVRLTGQRDAWFAYPDGVFGDREMEVAREVGFTGAVQTWREPWRRGPFAVPRAGVNSWNLCGGAKRPQPAQLKIALAGLSSSAIRSLWGGKDT
jgi:peptidoglycan/xylan/chitin deacetylase (PgdA/CDA1 family)